MRVLIAEDDADHRFTLEVLLEAWGYKAVTAEDGLHALDLLQGPKAPRLAILDWRMPRMDGIDCVGRYASGEDHPYTYIILLRPGTRSKMCGRGTEGRRR